MVTAAVVLTVAIDPKRSGAYRPGFVGLCPGFSLQGWQIGTHPFFGCRLHCSYVQVCCRVTRRVDLLLLLILSRLGTLSFRRTWVAWSSNLERPFFVSGYSTNDVMVA